VPGHNVRPRGTALLWSLASTTGLLAALWLCRVQAFAQPPPAAGDPLPRIHCPPGYTARIYAQGLRSPDGLAFSPAGVLYVAEERPGRVSRVDADGSVTPVLSGLNSPEGIAFDDAGNLYVVEDVPSGRLVKRTPGGEISTLAAGLEAPEGVAWVPGDALYVTESSLEFFQKPQDLRSRITRVSLSGEVTRVLTDTPTIDDTHVTFNSYAGIAVGPDDRLYVTNELSGVEITQTVVLIPGVLTTTFTLSTTDSVFAVDSGVGTRTLLASGLFSPEGLRFSPGSPSPPRFPLYVAEEDIGDGGGRLSVVGPDGRPSTLCTGFLSIEDVVLDEQARLYVSEGENNGSVIQIEPPRTAPRTVDLDGPTTALIRQNSTFTATVHPITTTLPITFEWSATGRVPGTEPKMVVAGLSVTAAFAWSAPGPQQIAVTATNVEGAVTGTHALTVYVPPTAGFSGAPTRGIAPLTVAFANRTTGDYTTSLWEFGDGLTATAHNPVHTYRAAGAYTVTLSVSGPGGGDSEIKRAYITAFKGLYLPLVVRAW
jgi:hypothetical protein